MKILIFCRYYLPLVGGIPIRMRILAEQFVQLGHQVTVVTDTLGLDDPNDVIVTRRKIGKIELLKLTYDHDILLSANISLNSIPIFLLSRKTVFVAHGGGYSSNELFGIPSWLKLKLCFLVNNIYCSKVVQKWISAPGKVLPNTYRADIFCDYPNVYRNKDIITYGRLVSDKGFIHAIQAIEKLKDKGINRHLTIVGDGEERNVLQAYVSDNALENNITFAGEIRGISLAKTLASHAIAIIPSLWEEPFGNVALEALGCGCKLIVSDGGGLPEAAGPCGQVFTRGNATELAQKIIETDNIDIMNSAYQQKRSSHLSKYEPKNVAISYIEEFKRVLNIK